MNFKDAVVSDEFLVDEAKRIISQAEKQGMILRLIGAIAIWCHSGEYSKMYKNLKRLGDDRMFTDIDLISYSKQFTQIKDFLKRLGFVPDKYILALFSSTRLIFYHPKRYYHMDVFFDKLEFSHDVVFGNKPGKGRLELDYPTITLADLVLEKLQIHEINEKDIKDLIVLFIAHELGNDDEKEIINIKRIAEVLSDDWGFWYDATNNLKKMRLFAKKYCSNGLISEAVLASVISKIDKLLNAIEAEPKTKKWKKRAKIGTKKPWYRVVQEFEIRKR